MTDTKPSAPGGDDSAHRAEPRRAAKAVDQDAESLVQEGVNLCRRARWREAIDPLQRAVEMNPENAAAHYQLGEAYNQTDRLAEALTAYETAARLQPDHWRALKGVGIILDRLGRPIDANAAYQRARAAHGR